MSTTTVLPDEQTLARNSLSWKGQVFQAIAHMAPALGVIAAMPFMASRAGSALPLAMVFATVMCLMLAYCLGLLTRKYYGASGYFQIHSQALGSKLGFYHQLAIFPVRAVECFRYHSGLWRVGLGTVFKSHTWLHHSLLASVDRRQHHRYGLVAVEYQKLDPRHCNFGCD